jgi:hypothetical protein
MRRSPMVLLLIAAALSACGDDGASGDGDDGDDTAPAYLVGTRIFDDTTTTSYFSVVDSLGAETEVDLADALEVPGAAKLFSVGEVGWFAVGGGEAPTITRYQLVNGRLVEDEEAPAISLQQYGVDSLWDTVYVVSDDKAYYPDRDGQQLIVWNPTDMAITGTIDLSETGREGFLSLYGYAAIRRGDDLLFPVGWFDWSENDDVLEETGLVVIDTTDDTLARFDVDDRCGGVTQTIELESGDAYVASSALAVAAHRLGRLPTAPCALRIAAGEDEFDPDYAPAISELTGGDLAGEPVAGGGNRIFLRSFDEDLAEVSEQNATYELTGQAAWRWWAWDVEGGEAELVETLEPATADVLWFVVDGTVYGSQTKTDYSETTLVDLTAEGGPIDAMTVPGFLHGVARIR